MGVQIKETGITRVVRAAAEKHGATREALIPILSDINRELGYIPREAFYEIRQLIHVPENGVFLADSHVFSVASFYHMLSLRPLGKHVVRFCESAPCHVMGGRQVIKALKNELRIDPGETSPDGEWTLITTSCLGLCAIGPLFLVEDDLYGNVVPEKVPEILAKYVDPGAKAKDEEGRGL
jgi:NADH-quinone oxidoreductase subunit E